ncbi:MAG: hypothetical protein WDN23_15610 [Edaphobacter sp.]
MEADLPEEGILGADDRLVEGILVGAIRAGEDLPEEGTQVVDDRLVEGILAGEGLLVEAILGVDRLGGGPPPRPNPSRPVPGRPPSWGRPPVNRPSYGWRPNDRAWLHRYYGRDLGYINTGLRPRFVVGGFFPFAYIPYITPVPPAVYGYLPPPPPGYQIGYYQGYVVVYDPVTYFIANVIDLM